MTPEDVNQQEDHLHELVLPVRNSGKRGPDDELSTLNDITLGIPLPCDDPQSGTGGALTRFTPCFAMADGRYEFLLVAPPLPITNAVETPRHPDAMQ